LLYGVLVSRPRANGAVRRRIPRAPRALLNLPMPASLRPCDSGKALSARKPASCLRRQAGRRNSCFGRAIRKPPPSARSQSAPIHRPDCRHTRMISVAGDAVISAALSCMPRRGRRGPFRPCAQSPRKGCAQTAR
jgi:hypothetical protein